MQDRFPGAGQDGPEAIADVKGQEWAARVTENVWNLIDTGSFSNLWFWLFMGVLWSHVMHAPMGVPVDLVRRAQSGDRQAETDLQALSGVQIAQAERMQGMAVWRAGGWAFVLTLLAGLAVPQGSEVAQAGLALAAPLALVRWFEARAARHMADVPDMAALIRAHTILRRKVQAVGIVAVFLTSIFGMLRVMVDRTF